ncbi:hypothetical protein QA584_14840 [Anaerocolumna sp. AGMB13025]|uniref:hypothetical protein n=1 Tax=Anaerocolumna sp. AGMB13025 TaxID=3039116 RepID=UPI00241E69D5|nr:hypothetical protein [Anaerocolumna sp. AGMB13025]WFR54894.1 hypothetical protein QA584_14840 [Anaerocolumna sp. AGMB13025]
MLIEANTLKLIIVMEACQINYFLVCYVLRIITAGSRIYVKHHKNNFFVNNCTCESTNFLL